MIDRMEISCTAVVMVVCSIPLLLLLSYERSSEAEAASAIT